MFGTACSFRPWAQWSSADACAPPPARSLGAHRLGLAPGAHAITHPLLGHGPPVPATISLPHLPATSAHFLACKIGLKAQLPFPARPALVAISRHCACGCVPRTFFLRAGSGRRRSCRGSRCWRASAWRGRRCHTLPGTTRRWPPSSSCSPSSAAAQVRGTGYLGRGGYLDRVH